MGFDVSSRDFNDYMDMGIYYNGGTNSNFTNAPHAADNGFLIVFKSTRSRQISFVKICVQCLPIALRKLVTIL